MSIGLKDVVALVTGANGGIGAAICRALKESEAVVIGADLQETPDAALAVDHYRQLDVTQQAGWEEIAEDIETRFGRLDALVNNAAISVVGKIEETSIDEWRRVNAVNCESVVLGVQSLLKLLRAGGKHRSGGASVVNISSVGGQRGAAFNAAYCVSKAAVAMLSKCMAAEFAALRYNIRVNSVHPGGVDTAMLSSIMDRYVELGAVPSRDAAQAGIVSNHPIGRLGRPDEIGGGVVYLCSDTASFVTASELTVDGGFTAV